MTPAEIEAFKALCDAATPGPWVLTPMDPTDETNFTIEPNVIWLGQVAEGRDIEPADAAFIAAARTAVPALLSALEEATKARSPFDKVGADRLADEVAVLVRRGIIDARSPAGDALLDYRNPPSTPRADRLAAAEARADALQRERDEMEKSKWYERDRRKEAEARADALQAEVESLRAGISYAVKRREEETARADAARRAVEVLRAAAEPVTGRLSSQRLVHRGRGEEWICEVSREALLAMLAALPPPSATAAPAEEEKCPECEGKKCHSVAPAFDSMCPECGGGRNWHHQHACPAARGLPLRAPSRGEVG